MGASLKDFAGGVAKRGWAFFVLVFLDISDVHQKYIQPFLPEEWREFTVPAVIFWPIVVLGLFWAAWATYDEERIKRTSQDALDGLSDLLSEGIHEILNKQVTRHDDLNELLKFNRDWEKRLFEYMDKNFRKSDAQHVKRLGVLENRMFPHQRNTKHAKILNHFAARQKKIEDIIRRGSV